VRLHRGNAVQPKDQLAAFLFTALLASASLLASAFGNLYSVYARFISEHAPICITIRWVCYAIAATVIIITVACAVILNFLSPSIDGMAWFIKYVLYLILVLINVTPITIAWRMYQDGRA
jgi:phage-related minor tail protein